MNQHAKTFCISILVLGIAATVHAQEKAPTEKQIKDATEAYRKVGGIYLPQTLPGTREKYHLFIANQSTKDADVKNLPKPGFAHFLSLNASLVTDACIKDLKALPNIIRLDFGGTRVTAEGLKELKDFKGLKSLGLDRFQLNDKSLKVLHENDQLHLIARPYGGKFPTSLKEMEELDLLGSEISNVGFKLLAGMTGIKKLTLGGQLTPECVAELKQFKELRELSLFIKLATDASLKELKDLPKLERLEISAGDVTDQGLRELKSIKSLKHVDARNTKVTAAGVKELQQALPKAKILH